MKHVYYKIIIAILLSSCNSKKQENKKKIATPEIAEKSTTNRKLIYDSIWKDEFGKNKFKVLKEEDDEYQALTNIKMIFSLTNEKNTIELIDSVSNCPVEFHMKLLKESIKLTDLNQDNKKELLFAYAYTCRGDMIGDTLRVIAIEDNKISSIKGIRTNQMDEQIAEFEKRKATGFGEITESNVPDYLKDTATKLWLKHSKEKNIKSDLEVEEFHNSK